MHSGVLIVDKPAGLSSAQVVSRVKRILKPSKIGHAGTLDPLATGVLVCLLGSSTRLASFAEGGAKTYSGIIRFGLTTETDDIEGKVITQRPVEISAEILEREALKFVGAQQQLPPRVSAIKQNGVPAYERVRANQEVTLVPRPVVIESLSMELLPPDRARYLVRCSKGTYIRSIARDLGALLGCGGIVETLRRERSEPFGVEQGCALEEVCGSAILPWEALFPGVPRLSLGARELVALEAGDQRCLAAPELVEVAKGLLSGATTGNILLYGASDAERSRGILQLEGDRLTLGLHLRE